MTPTGTGFLETVGEACARTGWWVHACVRMHVIRVTHYARNAPQELVQKLEATPRKYARF
jgi:hypothetical protein